MKPAWGASIRTYAMRSCDTGKLASPPLKEAPLLPGEELAQVEIGVKLAFKGAAVAAGWSATQRWSKAARLARH